MVSGTLMLTDLAITPISETLRNLSIDRRSGDLQVQSGRTVKTVFWAEPPQSNRVMRCITLSGGMTRYRFRSAQTSCSTVSTASA